MLDFNDNGIPDLVDPLSPLYDDKRPVRTRFRPSPGGNGMLTLGAILVVIVVLVVFFLGLEWALETWFKPF